MTGNQHLRGALGRALLWLAVVAVVILATPSAAQAHAVLVSSSPAAGATLAAAPDAVRPRTSTSRWRRRCRMPRSSTRPAGDSPRPCPAKRMRVPWMPPPRASTTSPGPRSARSTATPSTVSCSSASASRSLSTRQRCARRRSRRCRRRGAARPGVRMSAPGMRAGGAATRGGGPSGGPRGGRAGRGYAADQRRGGSGDRGESGDRASVRAGDRRLPCRSAPPVQPGWSAAVRRRPGRHRGAARTPVDAVWWAVSSSR